MTAIDCSWWLEWQSIARLDDQASLAAAAVGLALSGKLARGAGEIVIIIIIIIIMVTTDITFSIIVIFTTILIIIDEWWFPGLTETTDLQLEKRKWMAEWAPERATLGGCTFQANLILYWHNQGSLWWLAPWGRGWGPGWNWSTGIIRTNHSVKKQGKKWSTVEKMS